MRRKLKRGRSVWTQHWTTELGFISSRVAWLLLSSMPAYAGPMTDAYNKQQQAYREYHQKLDQLPATAGPKERRELHQKILAPTIAGQSKAMIQLEADAVKHFRQEYVKERFKNTPSPLIKAWAETPEKLPKNFSILKALSEAHKKPDPAGKTSAKPDTIGTPGPTSRRGPIKPSEPNSSNSPGPVLDGTGIPTELEFSGKKTNSPPGKRPPK